MTPRIILAITTATLVLAGCGGAGTPGGSRPAAKAGWASREQVGDAIALLNRGEPEKARAILMRALEKQPGDATVRTLLHQIDTPAETLLGKASFSYIVRTEDSMSSLAQRFLRDPMMFYALARYNGIMPGELSAGSTIRIPGRMAAKPAKQNDARGSARIVPEAAPSAAAKMPPPAARPPDARHAAQLRAQGLEQLNRGAVNRAVALLQQASRTDPGSTIIRRDLDRAIRIQKTVRGNGT